MREKFRDKVTRLVYQKHDNVGKEEEKAVPWRLKEWRELVKVLVLVIVSHDYMHQHKLYTVGRQRGGFVPIALVAFFSVTMHLPLMELYAQIGHFVQASSVRVWGTYGRAFGWIGLMMLLSSSYEASLQTYQGSSDFTVWLEGNMWKNMSHMTTCHGKALSIYGDHPYRDKCCMSITDKKICQRQKPQPDWCHQIDPFLCFPVPATFSNVRSNSARQTMAYVSEVLFVATGLIALAMPFLVFLGITVAVGLFGIGGSLICSLFFIESGDLLAGILKMWRFTRLSVLTESEMWYDVLVTVLLYSCSKFTVTSVASTVSRRTRLYLPVLFCYFVHISIVLVYFLSDLAMFGALENGATSLQMPTSVPDVGIHDINLVAVPEFLGLVGMGDTWLFVFDLSVTMMRLATSCAPFLCATATYYHEKKSLIKRTLLVTFVVVTQNAILFILYVTDGATANLLEDHLNVLNCLLIVCSLLVGIVIYGVLNHTQDLNRTYPVSSWRWYNYLGPTSPFYFGCLRAVVPPSIALFLILSVLRITNSWSSYHDEESFMPGAFLSLSVYLFYLMVTCAAIVQDIAIPWYKDQIRLWEAFYPRERHPSFGRITLWRLEEALKAETVRLKNPSALQPPQDTGGHKDG